MRATLGVSDCFYNAGGLCRYALGSFCLQGIPVMANRSLTHTTLAAIVAALAGSCLVAGGCLNSMADVDEATAKIIQERSSLLRVPVPSRPRGEPEGVDAAGVREMHPSTVNPTADELKFTPAAEGRELEKRLAAYLQPGADARELTLGDALRQSQQTGRELLNAEESYILAAISLLLERHAWDPQFFASISPQVIAFNSSGTPSTTALTVVNELSVTQKLPYGGTIAATYVYALTEQLRNASTQGYTSASNLILAANIPLLRGAGDVAREDLIQAERNMVYASRTFEDFRRGYLVSITRDYLSLVLARQAIANQQNQIDLLNWLVTRTRALVEAGFLAEFQLNIANSDLLRATSTLARLQESYLLSADRFKIRLGLPVSEAITVKLQTPEIPEPSISPADAAVLALEYRLDLQTQRDIVDDAKRAVRNAENGLLPDLNIVASSNLNRNVQKAADLGLIAPDPATYQAGVVFGIPLDRTNERLQLRQATIQEQQVLRNYTQFRDNVVVEARSRVREIDRTRFALQLAEEGVKINLRRKQEQELKADEVTAQQVVDTANSLREAQNARDAALVDLRLAVLDYLLSTGQLRVSRDGVLEPLPGMVITPPPPEPGPGPMPIPVNPPTDPPVIQPRPGQ